MSALPELIAFYSQYLLTTCFVPAGYYWCPYDRAWAQTHEDRVLIDRPRQDWSLAVIWADDHYRATLCETYAGSELCEFCFRDIDALLPLLSGFQTQIDRMIDVGV
jgi:nitrate reductase beta subunit